MLDVNSPELFGPRNSRYEVADFIINDLKAAYPDLPKEKNIGSNDKGKVSQEAAKAFLARVLLHEATWEKYVPEIGYNLDGDGTSQGAGAAKPEGYLSTTDMLTQAKQMAKEVIDEANTGTFQLWNECDSLSYYYLFSIDEKGGNICNFKGAGKNTNKEFIFSVKYDFDTKRPGLNLSHIVATKQGAEFSAIFGESFLCRNGLPIRISHTGNMTDAQNNPDLPVGRLSMENIAIVTIGSSVVHSCPIVHIGQRQETVANLVRNWASLILIPYIRKFLIIRTTLLSVASSPFILQLFMVVIIMVMVVGSLCQRGLNGLIIMSHSTSR